jgi:hypothetical protein
MPMIENLEIWIYSLLASSGEILSISSLAYLLSPFRSKRFLIKITWSFFLLFFLFLSIYYVILNIVDYLQYDTTTSIQTIYEQQPEFPTISICSRIDSNFEIKILDFWLNNENLTNEWKNHIEQYGDVYFGKCYRFNSGFNWTNQSVEIKKSKKISAEEGLWLMFYSNTSLDFGELKIHIHNNYIFSVLLLHFLIYLFYHLCIYTNFSHFLL